MAEIRAISIDLDNTLWDVVPVIEKAERNSYQILSERYPRIIERNSFEDILDLREHLFDSLPNVRHDLTELRRQVYISLLDQAGYDTGDAEELLSLFLIDRNKVDLYPDVIPALETLSRKFRLVTLSDGNSDLSKIRIRKYFDGCVYAADVGFMKPHQAGFLKVCEIAGTNPSETLHIGDHPVSDVNGARLAGLRSMWIRRNEEQWEHPFLPDYSIVSMAEAVDRLC